MAVNYSLKNEYYQDVKKSCFTVALNIACDNCKTIINEPLSESEKLVKGCGVFLKEAQRSKGGIEESRLDNDTQKAVAERLNDIRNYFSHYYHSDKCLIFEKDSPVKVFLESVYEAAQSSVVGGTRQSDYKGVMPDIFEPHNGGYMITAAGVILLASFFCHRSNVYRMLGAVKGFKHTGKVVLSNDEKRDYGFTRRLMAHFSLRDSYSIKSDETKSFRDLLGYLSLVPQQAVDWLNEHNDLSEDEKKEFLKQQASEEKKESPEQTKSENEEKRTDKTPRRSLRKTNKFILFAIKFIEDWGQEEILDVSFARYKKDVADEKNKKQNGKQERDVRIKYEDKPKEPFYAHWTYYIQNDHAIIQIKTSGKNAVSARISENELKYLVLLIFEGKGRKAFYRLADYIFRFSQSITHNNYKPKDARRIPSFLKNPSKTITNEMVQNRLKYIRDELEKVKETIGKEEPENDKWLMYKGKKISIILKFISDSIAEIKRRFDVEEYNDLRDALQKLDWDGFYGKLGSCVSDGRIEQTLYDEIKNINDISKLCVKVCELRLAALKELENKDGSELYKYIGLEVQEKHDKYDESNTPQKKSERFLNSQFSVGKNFLRETFYDEYLRNRKSLYEIVKEKLKDITPLNEDRWYLKDKNPKDYDRKTEDGKASNKLIRQLCNIYIQDVLCMKMALWYYENLSPAYKDKLKWDSTGQGFGYDRYKLSYRTGCGVTIEFKLADLTRLDIIEKPAMIENICRSFIKSKDGKERILSWHDFRQEGIEGYRKQQKDAVRAVFEFEKCLKIPESKWLPKGYAPFKYILEEAVRHGKIKQDDKESLRQVRNDFFHEKFESTEDQRKMFDKYMPVSKDSKNKAVKS